MSVCAGQVYWCALIHKTRHSGKRLVWTTWGLSVCGRSAARIRFDTQARADYFDSIHYSAAVMGINTSALIESAIVGRPVFTLLAPEFRDTQEGTLHFHHLLRVNGGLLRVAHNFEEHAAQLLEAVSADDTWQQREAAHNRRFLEGFVRPHGLDEPVTPRLVDEIEKLAARPAPHPSTRSISEHYGRWSGGSRRIATGRSSARRHPLILARLGLMRAILRRGTAFHQDDDLPANEHQSREPPRARLFARTVDS